MSPNSAADSAKTGDRTTDHTFDFDWADLAFGSKKPLKELRAVFIAAPRELSAVRFTQLIKTYLPQGNIILGLAKEPFVAGFDGQPQFRTLQAKAIQKTIDLVNVTSKNHKIYLLHYFQRELPYIIEKIPFKRAVLVRGSWQHVFHVSPAYYALVNGRTPYDMVSPFTSEAEAKAYEATADSQIVTRLDSLDILGKRGYNEQKMLHIANLSASRSYDYSFQTGAALGKAQPGHPDRYSLLISTFNKVVPYQTYAMHYGASREEHFSPPNDLNHYDAVHAEVCLLAEAARASQKVSLRGTTLFINLMPCPSCARMFTQTDIAEFVYSVDHSDGYAIKLLETVGKKVRRIML